MFRYARTAKDRGLQVIVAGAGGAAHLPGMVASMTPLPVIGVPVRASGSDGQDSLLSIVQVIFFPLTLRWRGYLFFLAGLLIDLLFDSSIQLSVYF